MWGAIAGAAASVIGSLFGGSDDEEVTTTIDYGAMAKAAEKAGFNPLTAIRNGGSAGFTTTHHPGLSAMSRIGNAAQTLGNALMAFDERADERAYREQALLRGQLDKVQRAGGASQRMWSMDVPTAQGSTTSAKPATGGAGAGYFVTTDLGRTPKPEFEPVTEVDEAVAGVQQVVTAVKDAWREDPIHEWWRKVYTEGPRAPQIWKMPGPASKRPKWPYTPTPGYNRHSLAY